MNSEFRVMLGMSFFKNHADAKKTAKEFSDRLCAQRWIVLGIETEASRKQNLPDLEEPMTALLEELRNQNWPEVYVWDKDCDEQVLAQWPKALSMPFYHNHSYGGAVNRLLALAKVAGCGYLVRVDPGTAPSDNFVDVVSSHVKKLCNGEARVVSGQYTDRIALRDNFVPPERREDYYKFIQEYTGIDPHPNKQVTGGAALTIAVTGPPAIPFNGAMVWASDDGYFQLAFPNSAVVVLESRIPRTDPGGHARTGIDYFVRLASMVVLHELHKGCDEPQAEHRTQEFLKRLVAYLDTKHGEDFDNIKAYTELKIRIKIISEGYKDYNLLQDHWRDVINELGRIANSLSPDCRCQVK